MSPTRFPIRFTGLNKAMVVLGLFRRTCYVTVDAAEVRAVMGWTFRTTIDRTSIHSVAPYSGLIFGWGAHGFRGRWLINGSSTGIVRIICSPPSKARLMGIWPVRLRTLFVSVEDPDGLIQALS